MDNKLGLRAFKHNRHSEARVINNKTVSTKNNRGYLVAIRIGKIAAYLVVRFKALNSATDNAATCNNKKRKGAVSKINGQHTNHCFFYQDVEACTASNSAFKYVGSKI